MMMTTTMMMTSRRTVILVVGLGGEENRKRNEAYKREDYLGIAKQLELSLQQGWEGGTG